MTVSEDDDAKFALTEYAVMAHGGHRVRLGGGAAHHRAHPPDPRASGQPGHAHRGRFQIWRHGLRAAKGDIADKLHLHARSIDIGRPDGGRLQATAPLPPHMVKSWKLLGFDPDDTRDPFPPKKRPKRKMKRFLQGRFGRAGGGRLWRAAGRQAGQDARRAIHCCLPTEKLAAAIAAEWRGQGEEVVATTMPLLRLANTVIDGVAANREEVIDAILRFGENDLLCYRAHQPPELVARQTRRLGPAAGLGARNAMAPA